MEQKIASHLLEIEAVFLRPNQPFTWASGIISPIYCDNRLTLSYPQVRKDIETGLAELIRKEYPEVEAIMGTATAGIAHAALVADILELPMGYVRGGAKSHGRNNQIEGLVRKGMKVVVVEDLLSTGGSSLETVEALREAECEVLGLVAIFSYQLPKLQENFQRANLSYATLSNYDALITTALKKELIQEEDLEKLRKWRNNPHDASWQNN